MADKPSKGLADVVAASTALSDIDGQAGRLFYRGYDIHQLAGASTFEEIAYLLQRGSAPDAGELGGYRAELAAGRPLGKLVSSMLPEIAVSQGPMEAMRSLVSLASADDPDESSNAPAANERKAARLTAQQPILVAAYHAAREGRECVPADPGLSLAANFLFQLRGTAPPARDAEILDTCLVLHADHTMNASTFAARVCAATLSDMHSAVVAALGTLKGPLHGGANEQVMRGLEAIRASAAGPGRRGRPGGPGTAGGRGEDHGLRSPGLQDRGSARHPPAPDVRGTGGRVGGRHVLPHVPAMEETVFADKGLYPNVDFYAATVYHYLGIPTDLFTPVFSVSRMAAGPPT